MPWIWGVVPCGRMKASGIGLPFPMVDFIKLLPIDDHVGIQRLPISQFPEKPWLRDSEGFDQFDHAPVGYASVGLIQHEKKRKRNRVAGAILGSDSMAWKAESWPLEVGFLFWAWSFFRLSNAGLAHLAYFQCCWGVGFTWSFSVGPVLLSLSSSSKKNRVSLKIRFSLWAAKHAVNSSGLQF